MTCQGYATIYVDGVRIKLLVTDEVSNELVLSWHDLVSINVIPADFPAKLQLLNDEEEDSLDKILEDFSDVLSNNLPDRPMAGDPITIDLDHTMDITPKKVYGMKQTPTYWQKEAQDLVNMFIEDGVIEEVHEETTEWVSRSPAPRKS